jgi:hypothetical protein
MPVAVMITSASRCLPDFNTMPEAFMWSMWSVTISTSPAATAW